MLLYCLNVYLLPHCLGKFYCYKIAIADEEGASNVKMPITIANRQLHFKDEIALLISICIFKKQAASYAVLHACTIDLPHCLWYQYLTYHDGKTIAVSNFCCSLYIHLLLFNKFSDGKRAICILDN